MHAGFDLGQSEDGNYFGQGAAGYHRQWDSRLFNYRNWETLRLLLSNLRWWLDEYRLCDNCCSCMLARMVYA